jgi:hypothetical protein
MMSFVLLPVIITLFCLFAGCIDNQDEIGGYLFAHMMKDDYGSLYYSISRDGSNWVLLNEGKRIHSIYRGHPDICRGRNGEYYMIGVEAETLVPILWSSDDLLHWEVQKRLKKQIFQDNTSGFNANPSWWGAPKMYFDENSDHYLISWHASRVGTGNGRERWKSMRTFYILSHDLENFTTPARLFNFDSEADRSMATIDVIIRRYREGYFALIKDERWPEDIKTGKTIRMSFSENLTGPYSNPGPPVTPSWYEAPSIVPGKNGGWIMYAENYPHRYSVFYTDSLNGTWQQSEIKLPDVRHGCVVPISSGQYERLLSLYGSMPL